MKKVSNCDVYQFAISSSCGELGNSVPSGLHQSARGGGLSARYTLHGRPRAYNVSTLCRSPKALNRRSAVNGKQNT